MSEKIIQLNEEVIKGEIRDLVRGSVEETPGRLLEAEAEKLTQAARYAIERINREIRRRTRVVGVFPDGNSALMLVCARLRHVAGAQWGGKKTMCMKRLEAMEKESAASQQKPQQDVKGCASVFATLDACSALCCIAIKGRIPVPMSISLARLAGFCASFLTVPRCARRSESVWQESTRTSPSLANFCTNRSKYAKILAPILQNTKEFRSPVKKTPPLRSISVKEIAKGVFSCA